MFAISIGARLLAGAAITTGLALAALGFGAGAATATPAQPAPADIPFLPIDPSTIGGGLPGLSGFGGGITPLIGDATKLLTAGADPNAYVADFQGLLNDAGSMLGMPQVGSLMPATGIPGAPPLAPGSPLTPYSPLTPVTPLSPLTSPGSLAPLV